MMLTMKKLLLRISPYFACVVAGTLLFILASGLSGDSKMLLLTIAGAFFVVPCLYVIYETAQRFSKKRLNKELFDYAKMQIDREILSAVNQLMKMVYPYDKQDFSFQGIQTFLSQDKAQIRALIENSEYLGFQVFKNWSISESNMCSILENPFILQRLEDDQAISIITLIKEMRSLGTIQENAHKLYEVTEKRVDGYKIQGGKELNETNVKYPDRYLLLRHLGGGKYEVADFGDFTPYHLSKLLNIGRVSNKYLEAYAHEISEMLKRINDWLELTGSEFLIDTKMFRLGSKRNMEPTKQQ